MILATLAAASLCAGCDTGEDNKHDDDQDEEYVDSGIYCDIPDEVFCARLLEMGVDYNQDGAISTSEAARWKKIEIQNGHDIQSLKGIEYFTGLTELTVTGEAGVDPEGEAHISGQIQAIDLSCNTDLALLDVRGNRIKELDLSACTRLRTLVCDFNELTRLDLSELSELTSVDCFHNPLRELTLGTHPHLLQLACFYCCLEQIDLSGCPALNYLVLMGPIPSLDLSACGELRILELYSTELESLDLKAQRKLTVLTGKWNERLTEIKHLGQNKGLRNLELAVNPQLTGTLHFEGYSALENISLDNNALTEFVAHDCAALKEIYCMTNPLTRFEVTDCPELERLSVSLGPDRQGAFRFGGLPRLAQFDCTGNKLTQLDLSEMPALESLSCANNNLTRLDLSHQSQLTYLSCDLNPLEQLDLTHCPLLDVITFYQTPIQTLDVSACADTFSVNCELDDALATIYCREGQVIEGWYPAHTQIVVR